MKPADEVRWCDCVVGVCEGKEASRCPYYQRNTDKARREGLDAAAEHCDKEAGIAHDDWNDHNLARQLSKVAEEIRALPTTT